MYDKNTTERRAALSWSKNGWGEEDDIQRNGCPEGPNNEGPSPLRTAVLLEPGILIKKVRTWDSVASSSRSGHLKSRFREPSNINMFGIFCIARELRDPQIWGWSSVYVKVRRI